MDSLNQQHVFIHLFRIELVLLKLKVVKISPEIFFNNYKDFIVRSALAILNFPKIGYTLENSACSVL